MRMDEKDERWQSVVSLNLAVVGPFSGRCSGSSRRIFETPDKTQPVTNRAYPYNAGQQQEYSGTASRFHVVKVLLLRTFGYGNVANRSNQIVEPWVGGCESSVNR